MTEDDFKWYKAVTACREYIRSSANVKRSLTKYFEKESLPQEWFDGVLSDAYKAVIGCANARTTY